MRALRYRGPMLVVVAAVMLATMAWANTFLFDFFGYDWFWPGAMGESNSCYGAVGEVVSVNPTYLNFDYGTYQYTFNWDYSCFASGDTLGGVYAVYSYDTSTSGFQIYCDSLATGTPADYGTFPPNAQLATWVDGELILGATWDGPVSIVVNLLTGEGNVNGLVNWDTGSQLANIPPAQRDQSMTLAGILFNPPAGPEGYHWQIDGQVFIQDPIPVEETSWGRIKSSFFRGN